MRKPGWIGLLVLLLLSGCASGAPWVKIGGQRYAVEIADDDAERARGLMFRDLLAEGHGMLFIRKLVAQQRDVPPCSLGDACPPYPSVAPARYVLELNAGEAARLELRDGAMIEFGPGIAVAD